MAEENATYVDEEGLVRVVRDDKLSIQDFLENYSLQNLISPEEPLPILLSIDFEAFEHDQKKITEIGITVLDLSKVSKDAEAKVKSSMWYKAAEHAHYIIHEHRHCKNKKWVTGCPDNFQFGESRKISMHKAAMLLDHVVKSPNQLHRANSDKFNLKPTKAKVVIVGHDFKSDDKYARTLGYVFPDMPGIDTRNIRGTQRGRGPGLGRLLHVLNLNPEYLHNAGNDAAYTLKAAIAMAAIESAPHGRGMTAAMLRTDDMDE